MKGMHRSTGRSIRDDVSYPDHLYQSIHDILSTLIGTRLCRREYGSIVPHLIDEPCNEFTQLKLMNASATALIRFEPRIKISQVMVSQSADTPGYWEFTIAGKQLSSSGDQPFNQIHLIGAAA
ncbi:GPW/gp25 family protein [Acinetobacter sp. WZC-1]|uniref:GPW/gp25 family protein n=1 Tax=Acinetobacter sp. WZC-1 TaxID=3459034 RepID=UPI00403DAE95